MASSSLGGLVRRGCGGLADLFNRGYEGLVGWFRRGSQRLRSCFQRQMSYNDVVNFGEVSDDIRATMTKVYSVQAFLVALAAIGFQTDLKGKIGDLNTGLLCIGSFAWCRLGPTNQVTRFFLLIITAFFFGVWLDPWKATYKSMIMDTFQAAFLVFLSFWTASLSVKERGKMYRIALISSVPQVFSCLGFFPGPFHLFENSWTIMMVWFLVINGFLTLYVLGYSQDIVAQAQGQQANVNYSPHPLSFYTDIFGIIWHTICILVGRFFHPGPDKEHQNVA